MPQRQGRDEPQFLSPEEWVEIRRITSEIMEVIPEIVRSDRLRHEVGAVLARNVLAANAQYDETLAAEEIHREPPSENTYQYPAHPIRECSLEFCGRYRGQRRDSSAV